MSTPTSWKASSPPPLPPCGISSTSHCSTTT
uniref:Uncharacterized protein n=1 Tax=Arundo donax TaxID=35708 RepID=A0A0A8YF32_ARUDO